MWAWGTGKGAGCSHVALRQDDATRAVNITRRTIAPVFLIALFSLSVSIVNGNALLASGDGSAFRALRTQLTEAVAAGLACRPG